MNQTKSHVLGEDVSSGRTISRLFLVAAIILLSGMTLRGILMRYARPNGIETGTSMPAITAAGWINGVAPDAETMRGKVVVVEFFATWCGPCREVTPELVETFRKYRERGVVFVALTTEDASATADIQKFVEQFQVPYVIGYGAEDTTRRFESEGIPRTWVIDRKGKVAWDSYQGGTLDAALEEVL